MLDGPRVCILVGLQVLLLEGLTECFVLKFFQKLSSKGSFEGGFMPWNSATKSLVSWEKDLTLREGSFRNQFSPLRQRFSGTLGTWLSLRRFELPFAGSMPSKWFRGLLVP
ncbi:hypothetical protein ACOSP7_023690 [Xanthoceras sorbifolium]